MTAGTDPWAPPERRTPPPDPPRRSGGVLRQVLAGLAVVSSAPALSGVLQGWFWLGAAALAVVLVVGVGLLVRATGDRPWWLVVTAQAAALLVLLTVSFGRDAPLGVIPGPATIGGLLDQLGGLAELIGSAIPPLAATGPLLLLVCLAYGVFAIVADVLTATGHGPAACGLVLLCALTVAATLSRAALPNWSLISGAAGFGLLLLADQRSRLRGRATDVAPEPDRHTAGAEPAGTDRSGTIGGRSLASGLAVTVCAAALALLVGALATAVGTEGRFPGRAAAQPGADLQFGLNPFTSLRNQLKVPEPVDLLRVRGLPPGTYLRALTLSRYEPSRGWELPRELDDTVLDATLPTGLPAPPTAVPTVVDIENLAYRDRWLPLVGLPLGVTGVAPGRWRYDTSSATAHTSTAVFEQRWVERAVVQNPRAGVLNAVGQTTDVNPAFLNTAGMDPRIGRLAASVTARARTPFTKAAALNEYFLDPANGFRYSQTSAPGNSGTALVDFLERSKIGYCEQYASAMAVMLRTVGVPARVAIGFTPGRDDAGVRTIGTRDAHAWVEAFFPGYGWLPFDPTPLGDGRTALPDYLSGARDLPGARPRADRAEPESGDEEEEESDGDEQDPEPPQPSSVAPVPDAPPVAPAPTPGPGTREVGPSPDAGRPEPGPGEPSGSEPSGSGSSGSESSGTESPDGGAQGEQPEAPGGTSWLAGAVLTGLLVALGVVALVSTPSVLRRVLRHHRTRLAGRGGPAGAAAAWREVLAESVDRGGARPTDGTVRSAARSLVLRHRLDAEATRAVRVMVDAVERCWYAPSAGGGAGATLVAALDEVAAGMDRTASPGAVDRLWPRSVRPVPRPRAAPPE